MIEGAQVTLRPFRPDELERVLEIRAQSPVVVGRADRERIRTRLLRSGTFADGRLDFAIEADGVLVGTVDARHPPHALPPGVYELGIELAEDARGRGYGSEAVALITEHLFAEHDAARVVASTAEWNTPMRRVLEKLGFLAEGVMRGFMPRSDGGRDDYVLYARLRDFS